MIKPKKLQIGDTIATISPSWGCAGDSEVNWNINSAFSDCKSGMEGNSFTLMNSHDIPDLIRYIHLCGCRITIEEVADHDVENPKNTPEELKKFHTDLKKAREDRIERKYR